MWRGDGPGPVVPVPTSASFPVFGLPAEWGGTRRLGRFEYAGSTLVLIALEHRRGDLWCDIFTYSNEAADAVDPSVVDRLGTRLDERLGLPPGSRRPEPRRAYSERVDVAGTVHELRFLSYATFDAAALKLDAHGVTVVIERSRDDHGPVRLSQVVDLAAYA